MDGQWISIVTIMCFTGGGLVATTAYLKGKIEGLHDEVKRQNGIDRDLLARTDRMVEKKECKNHREQLRRELK